MTGIANIAASALSGSTSDWNCKACGAQSQRLFQAHQIWIRKCPRCRTRLAEYEPGPAHVDSVYSEEYFTGGGAGYRDYLSEGSLLRNHGQRYARLLARYCRPGRVLDVGCAAGFCLQGFADYGWQPCGVEPNGAMAAYAKEKLGLDVRCGTMRDVPARGQFQLVSMIQVAAHFTDPVSELKLAAHVLSDRGFLLIETWNPESHTARIFGPSWHEYSPPSVLHCFPPTALEQLAARCGFRKVAQGRPSKWIGGGHAKSLLRFKCSESPVLRHLASLSHLIPDRLSIPYPAEDLYWMLLRKDEGQNTSVASEISASH